VPPWRDSSVDPDEIDPFALPQLTRRVAALVEAMYSCWGNAADWFLIADDDTFVRPGFLESALEHLDAGEVHLLGMPTSSDRFVLPAHQQQHGASTHCGGSSVLLSRGLMARLVGHIEFCLAGPPRTTLSWYWDEVELLGRCLYEVLRVNCSEPPRRPVEAGELSLGLMMSVRTAAEFEALKDYVDGDLGGKWERLPFATLHPVEAGQMRWLGVHFAGLPFVDHLLSRDL